MKQKPIVVATTNKRKLKEIQMIFSEFDVHSLDEFHYKKEIDEDGNTFEENASKKAKITSQDLHVLCLADDSGIGVDTLHGWPGIRTARFLTGTPRDRNLAILEKIKDFPKEKRKATFTVAIAVADADSKEFFTVVESLHGYIATTCRGSNGFGFDEIFELEDGRTLAELPLEEKLRISCRRKALDIAREKLNQKY